MLKLEGETLDMDLDSPPTIADPFSIFAVLLPARRGMEVSSLKGRVVMLVGKEKEDAPNVCGP